MARLVLKKLSKRELEILVQHAQNVAQAQAAVQQAQQTAQMFQAQYFSALELTTGDPNPQSIDVDIETREAFRDAPSKNGKRRATTKGKKKPTARVKKTGEPKGQSLV